MQGERVSLTTYGYVTSLTELANTHGVHLREDVSLLGRRSDAQLAARPTVEQLQRQVAGLREQLRQIHLSGAGAAGGGGAATAPPAPSSAPPPMLPTIMENLNNVLDLREAGAPDNNEQMRVINRVLAEAVDAHVDDPAALAEQIEAALADTGLQVQVINLDAPARDANAVHVPRRTQHSNEPAADADEDDDAFADNE